MDHSKHTPLGTHELNAATVTDADVYGPDDNNIGTVSHLHGTGAAAQVVVDVGGFLGLGAKPVALPASSLNFMRDENGKVHATTTMTKDQLKDLPEHKD
ncbi:PRC-barrel domain-containing protein [Oceaniglobus indicus]|uniref:PRC-barrel domain-containing protein n=1 Tax=Oceaniglobus indicus TaxID=2047749 RepID=UPI000C193321|nr:PRC-barrel domain-containing protein [Oceaniglobus indicus]